MNTVSFTLFLVMVTLSSVQASFAQDVVNSKVQIHQLNGEWLGVRTPPQTNRMAISGSLDLTKAFADIGSIPMNIVIQPGKFFLSYPGLIQGKVDLRDCAIQGVLSIRRLPSGKIQTEGPHIQAGIALAETSVFLPKA